MSSLIPILSWVIYAALLVVALIGIRRYLTKRRSRPFWQFTIWQFFILIAIWSLLIWMVYLWWMSFFEMERH